MIVVDTSVLIDLFRGRRTAAVEALLRLERDQTPFGDTRGVLSGSKSGGA